MCPGGGLRRRRHGPMACRACDAGTRLFGDGADLAADLPARRGRRVDVRIGRTRPDGGDHRGQVSRRELLGGH